MAISLNYLRRAGAQLAIRGAIAATARLPIEHQRRTIRSLVASAGSLPILRQRVRENMLLALGPDVPAHAERLYFRHLGWLLASSLATYHHGIDATHVLGEIKFDDSIDILDGAVAQGRGAVIVSPHWSGHELIAAQVNRRHPMALLVRQASTAEQMARKLKWYNALGAELVLRPRRASTVKDAVAYLSALKRGKVLAITPDLLAEAPQGIDTQIFGRPAKLHGGAFAIAIAARAPLVRCFVERQSEASLVLRFESTPALPVAGEREIAVRAAVQEWCNWFETKLRAHPENWLFWLDKRWSRFVRSTPRSPGAT